MPVDLSPVADQDARTPKFNSDPATLFNLGKSTSDRKTLLRVPVTTRAGTLTDGNATVTMADTSEVSVGDVVAGVGTSAGQAATTQGSGNTFTIDAHGAPNGTPFYLTALATTTGIETGKLCYVVGTATNTFQAALTPGGSPVVLTTNGTATVVFYRYVSAITADTSVDLHMPASASATGAILRFIGHDTDL